MTVFHIVLAGGLSDHRNGFSGSRERADRALKFTPAAMVFLPVDQPGSTRDEPRNLSPGFVVSQKESRDPGVAQSGVSLRFKGGWSGKEQGSEADAGGPSCPEAVS